MQDEARAKEQLLAELHELRARVAELESERAERNRGEQGLDEHIADLSQPPEDDASISFEDLFDLADLQHLQDLFANVWGVAALITRPDGTPITRPSNFTRLCGKLIRGNPEGLRNCHRSDAVIGRHNPSGPVIQSCLSAGLCNAGASITVGDRHVANWLIGQVRNEAHREEAILEYARELGVDEAECLEAFREVPCMPQVKFDQIAQTLFALANQLSATAYLSFRQARFIAGRKRVEEGLRRARADLETRVQERTAELSALNATLVSEIADRKRAEDALCRQGSTLRGILDASKESICLFDTEMTVLMANEAAAKRLGVPAEELIGRPLDQFFPGELARSRRAHLKKVVESAQPVEFEDERSGILFHHCLYPIADAEGGVARVVSYSQDITERERATRGLERALIKYRTLFDSFPLGITVSDPTGKILETNREAERLLRLPPDEHHRRAIDSPEWTIIRSDGTAMPADEFASVRALREQRLVQDVEMGIVKSPDETTWLSVTAIPVPLPDYGVLITYHDIGTRKQAEEALKQSEAHFRGYFELGLIGMAITSPDKGWVQFNDRLCDVLGYSREELSHLTWAEVTHPDDLAADVAQFDRVVRGEMDSYRLEKRFLRKDGRVVYAEISAKCVRQHDGRVDHFVAMVRDITGRRRAEEQRTAHLHFVECMNRINRTIQGTNDLDQMMSDVLDTILEVFDCDRAFLLYPCDPETPSWHVPMERTKPEYQGVFATGSEMVNDPEVSATFRTLLESNDAVPFGPGAEHPLPSNVADRFGYQALLAMALHPKIGKPWQFGIHQCSHPRVWTPEETRLFQEIGRRTADGLTSLLVFRNLKESEERLRLTLEATQIGIWDWDVEHDRWYASSTYYSMLGYEPDDGPGDRARWLERLHPEDRASVTGKIQSVIHGDFRDYRYEARMRHADGTYRWEQVQGFGIKRSQDQKVTRMLGIRMDITERKLAEEKLLEYRDHLEDLVRERTNELLAAMERAEAANQAKSVFLANMSHELRTPLNIILGFSQLLERDPAVSQANRETLAMIGRSGEHLLALINDVLEMSRIEAGHVALNLESIDLERALQNLGEMMRGRAEEKGLRLVVHRAPDAPRFVVADDSKLRQVLLNLIGNAIKFTSEGVVTLRVARLGETRGGSESKPAPVRLAFEVDDTGIGIPPGEIRSIFDPFVQARQQQAAMEGTGLGLAISRRFVELMGGAIVAENKPEGGCAFRFDIPVDLAVPDGIGAAERPGLRVKGLAPGQPSYRILVVEDMPESRHLMCRVLGRAGFEVREAANGQEAVEQFQQWEPHLIWMDMRMPGMDGHEATRRIKAIDRGSQTRIIAISASTFEEQRTLALASGCDGFVRKPFQEAEIFETMRQHLGVRYVYETGTAVVSPEGYDQLDQEGAAREGLRQLPPDTLAALEHAAESLKVNDVLAVIEEIRDIDQGIAEHLANLAKEFRYDVILDWIR